VNTASIRPIDLIAPGTLHIAAYEAGPADGPVMILLPGWPQTARAWRQVQVLLAAAGYRSIAIDLPGMGDSDFLPAGIAYDTGHVADLLSAAVAAAGIKSFTLVGHDVGTWTSYAWATRHPEPIERLCLSEAAVPGVTPDAAFGIANAARVFQFYFCAVEGLPEILTQGRERAFFEWLFESKALVKGAVDIDEYSQSYSRSGRMSAGFGYYRAVPISMKQNAAAAPPQMPLLALGGEGSVGDSLFRAIKAVAAQTQSGVMPGVGHYLPEEAPHDLVDRLLAFATTSSDQVVPDASNKPLEGEGGGNCAS
jgi:pimeloyl-ACP methyl ester carboxylesterase